MPSMVTRLPGVGQVGRGGTAERYVDVPEVGPLHNVSVEKSWPASPTWYWASIKPARKTHPVEQMARPTWP